jgi:hypothetical protein
MLQKELYDGRKGDAFRMNIYAVFQAATGRTAETSPVSGAVESTGPLATGGRARTVPVGRAG